MADTKELKKIKKIAKAPWKLIHGAKQWILIQWYVL